MLSTRGKIDVVITVHTLQDIHTFRKGRSMQISKCSPWGTEAKPFPSLGKKIKDNTEEWQTITNPFTHRSYPSRPNPSPFAKRHKATPVKRRNTVTNTRHNKQNLSKLKEVNVVFNPGFSQSNWHAQAKEVENASQDTNTNCADITISHLCAASQYISNVYTTSDNHL